MGAVFQIEHANIMAYVTSGSCAAPRVNKADLTGFLEALAYNARDILISERGHENWPYEIANIAKNSLSRLSETQQEGDTIYASTVESLLEDLRLELSCYPLYALAVGKGGPIHKAVRSLARRPTYGQLLVLIPNQHSTSQNFDLLDPIPAFSVALHAAADWPGIVFYTASGASAFARFDDVDELMHRLEQALRFFNFPQHPSPRLDAILREWERERPRRSRRLLHLSDLHFGTDYARDKQPLLKAQLANIVKSVDRVVITGDIFDTIDENYEPLFTDFRNYITSLAGGRRPIAVSGNHDQRVMGLFGDKYRQVALIGAPRVEVDDDCQMIFICFNSSEDNIWARGEIPENQFTQLTSEYTTLLNSRPELNNYLPIVLVHHHPFSLVKPPSSWVQRAFNVPQKLNEKLLVLTNAEKLHEWCLSHNIKTILHGHKHEKRYITKPIEPNGRNMILSAIGCGTSLGKGGLPVTYNMLEWNSDRQLWVASSFESVNGNAFQESLIAVSHLP